MTRVAELLRRKSAALVTVAPDATLDEAVAMLMQHGVGGLAVVADGGRLAGFVSERDIIAALREHPGNVRQLGVRVLMRQAPTCAAADPVNTVMRRMTAERVRHLVVLDAGRPVGVISVGDIVKHRLEELETEAGVLRDYVAAQRAV